MVHCVTDPAFAENIAICKYNPGIYLNQLIWEFFLPSNQKRVGQAPLLSLFTKQTLFSASVQNLCLYFYVMAGTVYIHPL